MEQNTNDEIEIDLKEIFFLIRARIWIILVSGILFAQLQGCLAVFLSHRFIRLQQNFIY